MVSSITGRGGMAHGWKMDKRELSSEEREKLWNKWLTAGDESTVLLYT